MHPVWSIYLPTRRRCEAHNIVAKSMPTPNQRRHTRLDIKTRHSLKVTSIKTLKMFQPIILDDESSLSTTMRLTWLGHSLHQLTTGKASQMHRGGIDAMASKPREMRWERSATQSVPFEIGMNEWFWISAIGLGLLLFFPCFTFFGVLI